VGGEVRGMCRLGFSTSVSLVSRGGTFLMVLILVEGFESVVVGFAGVCVVVAAASFPNYVRGSGGRGDTLLLNSTPGLCTETLTVSFLTILLPGLEYSTPLADFIVVSIGRGISTEMPPRKDLVSAPVIRESRVVRVSERESVDCGGEVIRMIESAELRFSPSEEGM
jgi:hypothetical protein